MPTGDLAIPSLSPDPTTANRVTASAVRTTAMLNGGAVVVAALYFGQELIVPLVLAGVLAFVLAPLARLLHRVARLPHSAASILAVVIAFVILGVLGVIVGGQVSTLIAKAPEYQANIVDKWQRLIDGNTFIARLAGPLANGFGNESASPLALIERFARPLLGPVTTFAVVLVFTLVFLLYSEDLRDRFVRLVGRRDLHRTIDAMTDAGHRLSRYFLSQLTINAAFGIWCGGALWLVGMPSPILLGLIAMLMRFVPFVGTFIGLGAPLLLAIAVSPGWTLALVVLAIFAVTEIVVAQILEPLLYGHSTGMSPVAVLVATSFWTLLWGVVGLLIATPLTVCLVVLGRNVAALSFLDVLFGSESPLLPAETFYQRALEGRSIDLLRAAQAEVKTSSRAAYYDSVALPALVLAQQDRRNEDLDANDAIVAQFGRLIEALAPESPVADGNWSEDGAILCLPARGDFDALAATMVVQSLQEAGFGAQLAPHAIVTGRGDRPPQPRLCFLSMVAAGEGASLATLRYFVDSIARTMPDTQIVVGLWSDPDDTELKDARQREGGAEHLINSIQVLVTHVRAVSAQAAPQRAETVAA